jgi:hypothetical protein
VDNQVEVESININDSALLVSSLLQDEEHYRFSFNANIDDSDVDMFAMDRSSAALSNIGVGVRHLLVANTRDVYELTLDNLGSDEEVLFNAPSLAYRVEPCQNPKTLRMVKLVSIDEDNFRVLVALSRLGLKIEVVNCRIAGAITSAVLAEILGCNQGPTKASLMVVGLTICFSWMGCAETVV